LRRASIPTTKKNNAMRPLFTHSRTESDTPEPPISIESDVSQSDS